MLRSLVLLLLVVPAARAAAPPPDALAPVRAVLADYCARCHGDHAKPKGGLGRITDLGHLIDAGQVVSGKPDRSPLFQRVLSREMPPYGTRSKGVFFSPADREILRDWIADGAKLPPHEPRFIAEADLTAIIDADLAALPARDRKFVRYLTMANLADRPAERFALRHALTKLVNSLSWHARLTPPTPLPGALVYRLDLRHYRWTARAWDRLVAAYPYATSPKSIRADWFVATASRPPAYHDFLTLPSTDKGLERLAGVDVATNLEEGTVIRAGFNGSGVARANRVLERHDSAHGAYWRSFDFSDNTGRQNIFAHPTGFRQAGGEIVFHLPNGLQGYMLVDADGRRIDRAPGEIVSDPKRPDRLVENGLSCMGCHVAGILPKDDQVRAHVLLSKAFTAEQRDDILALYAPAARMKKLVDEDNDRFAAALRKLGVPPGDPEPILAAVLRYEETVGGARAAEELGITPARLAELIAKDEDLARTLGPLRTRGVVQRQVFEESFPKLLPSTPAPVAVEGGYRGHTGNVLALAWSPDGKAFASGADDGEVRVWDVSTGKGRLLGKHASDVSALAWSPDGEQLLSGGADRVLRLWDVPSGKQLARLVGHTAGVRAIAFGPSLAVSAGEDRVLRVWDIETRKQTRTLSGHTATVNALALHDKTLLSGSSDRSARLWDLADGTETLRLAHAGAVLAVAFDGKRLLTATRGPDGERLVRAFDPAGRTLPGPARIEAAISGGRTLVVKGSAIEVVRPK
jgi:hypothetical protein